jgi:curved DNA-binding protein CbpA
LSEIDPYEVLGVKRDADITEIRKAYKELALKLHPDKIGSNPRALEQMKLVNESYAILSNKKVRVIVDDDEDWKERSTSEDKEKVWAEYSKQVEEYYRQVQKYLEDQLFAINKERERLLVMEQDQRRREAKLNEEKLRMERERVSANSLGADREASLRRREELLAVREAELDELMLLVSRTNSIIVDLVQSSKALRKMTK